MKERLNALQQKLNDFSMNEAESLLLFDFDDDGEPKNTKAHRSSLDDLRREAQALGYDILLRQDGLYNHYLLIKKEQ